MAQKVTNKRRGRAGGHLVAGRSFSVCQRFASLWASAAAQVVQAKDPRRRIGVEKNATPSRASSSSSSSVCCNGPRDDSLPLATKLVVANRCGGCQLTFDQIGSSSGQSQRCRTTNKIVCDSAAPVQVADGESDEMQLAVVANSTNTSTSAVSKVATANNSNYGNNGQVPTAQPKHNDTATSSMELLRRVNAGEESREPDGALSATTWKLSSSAHVNRLIGCRRRRDQAAGHLQALKWSRIEKVVRAKLLPKAGLVMFSLLVAMIIVFASSTFNQPISLAAAQTLQTDPRPTIYSGQISFGLLLSAHSSPGADLSTAASSLDGRLEVHEGGDTKDYDAQTMSSATAPTSQTAPTGHLLNATTSTTTNQTVAAVSLTSNGTLATVSVGPEANFGPVPLSDLLAEASAISSVDGRASGKSGHHLERRQIFERPSAHQVRRQQQQQHALELQKQAEAAAAAKQQQQQQAAALDSACSQVNPSALYAGMGAIWASHQANLVGDSQLAIGTYVYDSCNDLDIGQRQSVRIVSNLNAFQQTTCEAPRGSPISLTIAHGENQLRAIQLLTSFRVPVITTREPIALEDYHLLTKDQRRFLFSTAPSSRHLAVGALKFTKRVVARSAASPKLPNQHYKMSSKNGLIVISRNLPAKFIAYLAETIPNHVNYEILQTSQPIEQVRSVEAVESILLNSQTKRGGGGDDSTSGSSDSSSGGGSGSSAAASQQESRLVSLRAAPVLTGRRRRNSDDQDSGSSSDSSDSDSGGSDQQQHRMLSPTILMFITPSEAIDLVTRLRNDLAEVSRYYSLVVSTREDISPALRTIFHRGGSRLCSGKAFYTISPKPDEVSEFSRYFRDTVQMEGESSDHPLICEFSKHQTSSKTNADLDDISTEAVIKAVWAAAAAFKLVHKRECSAALGSPNSAGSNAVQVGNLYTGGNGAADHSNGGGGGGGEPTSTRSLKQGRRQSQTSPGRSSSTPHAECLVKMNKNMSNLVQRALKKLDVHINSTGLQSLDGFRIKFDESNELLTNKFSIKYITRECEITELGEYSGTKDSQLYLYEESALLKSLESTLPDPWPIPPPPTPPPATTSKSKSPTMAPGGSTSQQDETANTGDSSSGNQSDGSTSSGSGDEPNSPSPSSASKASSGDDDQDSSAQLDNEKQPSTLIENEAPKKRRSNGKLAKRKIQHESGRNQNNLASGRQQPVVLSGGARAGSGFRLPEGLTDFATEAAATPTTKTKKTTTNGPTLPTSTMASQSQTTAAASGAQQQQQQHKSMRKLRPFPPGKGVTLKEWLPKETATSEQVNTTPQRATGSSVTDVQSASDEPTSAATATSTTRAPATSTTFAPTSSLPESGGNTDLDMPAFKATTSTKPPARVQSHAKSARSSPDMTAAASSTTTELTGTGDYVTLPSVVRTTSSQLNPTGGDVDLLPQRPLSSVAAAADERPNESYRSYAMSGDTHLLNPRREPRLGFLRDLNNSPVPLPSGAPNSPMNNADMESSSTRPATDRNEHKHNISSSSRSRLRSHLKWIYGSWFTLTILGANICGALLTLYVLTFLLVKNCDGSLDRTNQGIRSMHLLSVIVVFFGSTLFIVYPTPSLCLLRSSWHNFALVLMFGSLLLQTMQTRSVSSIGLGGRPNRLNQLLTLLFMVGVQVSFELQRWKYESANYVNFVNQYFSSQENGDKKLLLFSNSLAGQFNPLNSFNDQVTPVSIQVSEKYQNLLHDYCSQPVEDFLQGQFYLWIIMSLLVVFSITNRRMNQCNTNQSHHQSKSAVGLLAQARGKRGKSKLNGGNKNKLAPTNYTLTSGKLLASQHETNELVASSSHLSPSSNTNATCQTFGGGAPFSMNSKVAQRRRPQTGDVFLVTLISVPIYFISVILQVHGQSFLAYDHHDLVASVTMVLVAFTVLIGIFLPVLKNYHRFGELVSGPSSPVSSSSLTAAVTGDHQHHHPILGATTLARARKRAATTTTTTMPYQSTAHNSASPSSSAFAMFPEFASTGLRRPSSIGGSGDSLGRRPFADTKESRRNMGLSLANLPPEPESLRGLCVHNHRSSLQPNNNHSNQQQQHRLSIGTCQGNGEQHTLSGSANLRLNLAGVDEEPQTDDQQADHHHHNHNHHHHQHTNDQLVHRNHNRQHNNHHHHHHHNHRKSQPSASSQRSSISSTGEKRLIMLDVDPCCPRHGVNNNSSPVG